MPRERGDCNMTIPLCLATEVKQEQEGGLLNVFPPLQRIECGANTIRVGGENVLSLTMYSQIYWRSHTLRFTLPFTILRPYIYCEHIRGKIEVSGMSLARSRKKFTIIKHTCSGTVYINIHIWISCNIQRDVALKLIITNLTYGLTPNNW